MSIAINDPRIVGLEVTKSSIVAELADGRTVSAARLPHAEPQHGAPRLVRHRGHPVGRDLDPLHQLPHERRPDYVR